MTRRPRVALTAALLGFFLISLDILIVNVALSSIRRDLGGDVSGQQWVVDGYTLMFAALLLLSGYLADRFGSRRIFVVGVALFFVASLVCAAPRPWGHSWQRESHRVQRPRSCSPHRRR